jgi:hypothetical protein
VSLNQVSRVEVARVYNTGDGVLNLTLTWVQTGGNLTGIQVDPAALSLGTNESELVYLVVNATSLGAVQGEVEIKPSAPKANATETGGTVLPMFTVEANITVIKPSTPAAFTSTDLVVKPANVNVNASVTVQVAVKNIGDLDGSTTVDLLVNGVKEQSKSVTLASGASTTVSFSVTKTTAGSYTVKVGDLTGSFTVVKPLTPAAFTFTSLVMSPANVTSGADVTVSVTVKNIGDLEGTYSAELKLDGATEETKTGTLAGGASTTVTFKVSSQAEGTHMVQVGTQTGSFIVVKPTTIDTGSAATPPKSPLMDANPGFPYAPVVGGAAALALLVIIYKLGRTSDRRPSLREMDKTRRGGKQGGRRKG